MDEAPWFRHYEEGVPRTIPYPEITLPEALDQTVARFPDRVALRFFLDARLPAPTLTYRQLQEQTLRFATALFQLGVRKGDRVALMLPNCPQFVVAFYGAMRIGAIPVNTNPMYVSREMREQFEDSGCETVVLLDQFYPRLREIHAATRVRRVIVVDVAESLPWPARLLAISWRTASRPAPGSPAPRRAVRSSWEPFPSSTSTDSPRCCSSVSGWRRRS
jgi:long-chain acyl-CoA synthetase